jgi:RNA polymerase sigma-54 factor
MDLAPRPELRHKVTLSPQVYQGLNILAMPIADLQLMVEAELLENPMLEVEEFEEGPEAEAEEERSESESEEEAAWDDWLDQYRDLDEAEPVVPRDPNASEVNTEDFVGGVVSFDEYLLEQLAMLTMPDPVRRAAAAVIGSLDDDGFLAASLTELAEIAGVTENVAAEGVAVVQQLDPPGVGARDVVEALKLQMAYLDIDDPVLAAIIDGHLDDVAASHFRKIARVLRVDEARVRETVEVLRTLNPRPAGAFSPGPSPGYVVPDVTLRRFGEDWLIISNNEAIPVLKVSPRYLQMMRSGSNVDDDTRRYLREKIRSAQAFIRNVDRRKDTVSRIAQIILETQRDFFDDGRGDLRPLRLEDVAVEMGVHLSTISRGVTGKYMSTPYGLFELKHFFSGGYRTSSGMDVASTTVKARIRELLRNEDAAKPLSDQKLAESLAADGVPVARRTVAKYREELGIEPSWARKRK